MRQTCFNFEPNLSNLQYLIRSVSFSLIYTSKHTPLGVGCNTRASSGLVFQSIVKVKCHFKKGGSSQNTHVGSEPSWEKVRQLYRSERP